MQKRREKATHTADITKPITTDMKKDMLAEEGEESCFGMEWDPTENECGLCADNELCCLLHKAVVNKRAKSIEKAGSAIFLDKCDFENIDKDKLIFQIDLNSGTMTAKELVETVAQTANTSDMEAARLWVKRFKEELGGKLSIKQGIVYYVKE